MIESKRDVDSPTQLILFLLEGGKTIRRVKERRSLSYITTSPSLMKGRGIKGEGSHIKNK